MNKKAKHFKSLVKRLSNNLPSKYCCSECGSTNIQIQAWVNANTHKYISDILDNNTECWCEDCSKHTKLKEV